MPAAFSRSLAALQAGSDRRSVGGILVAAALLSAWGSWLFFAKVARYEVSENARLEVGRTAHRVAAPIVGTVQAVRFELDAHVEAGDVLVELDDRPLLLKLAEQRARLEGARAQLEPLTRELAALNAALRETSEAGRMRVDEAKERIQEAKAVADLKTLEAQRGLRLSANGLLSEAESVRAKAEAEAAAASMRALAGAQAGAEAEQRSRFSQLVGEIAGLERQQTALNAEASVLEAEINVLLGEIERHKIRTPIAGRVGEVFVLRSGGYVEEGDVVATIVPEGDLRAVAEFSLSAVGRLAPGQPAQLRFDAFPWTEFGTVPAAVRAIATEAKEGRVRVELALEPEPSSPIILQHGLAGLAVVEVEQVSPWTLVLRAAGHYLRARSDLSAAANRGAE